MSGNFTIDKTDLIKYRSPISMALSAYSQSESAHKIHIKTETYDHHAFGIMHAEFLEKQLFAVPHQGPNTQANILIRHHRTKTANDIAVLSSRLLDFYTPGLFDIKFKLSAKDCAWDYYPGQVPMAINLHDLTNTELSEARKSQIIQQLCIEKILGQSLLEFDTPGYAYNDEGYRISKRHFNDGARFHFWQWSINEIDKAGYIESKTEERITRGAHRPLMWLHTRKTIKVNGRAVSQSGNYACNLDLALYEDLNDDRLFTETTPDIIKDVQTNPQAIHEQYKMLVAFVCTPHEFLMKTRHTSIGSDETQIKLYDQLAQHQENLKNSLLCSAKFRKYMREHKADCIVHVNALIKTNQSKYDDGNPYRFNALQKQAMLGHINELQAQALQPPILPNVNETSIAELNQVILQIEAFEELINAEQRPPVCQEFIGEASAKLVNSISDIHSYEDYEQFNALKHSIEQLTGDGFEPALIAAAKSNALNGELAKINAQITQASRKGISAGVRRFNFLLSLNWLAADQADQLAQTYIRLEQNPHASVQLIKNPPKGLAKQLIEHELRKYKAVDDEDNIAIAQDPQAHSRINTLLSTDSLKEMYNNRSRISGFKLAALFIHAMNTHRIDGLNIAEMPLKARLALVDGYQKAKPYLPVELYSEAVNNVLFDLDNYVNTNVSFKNPLSTQSLKNIEPTRQGSVQVLSLLDREAGTKTYNKHLIAQVCFGSESRFAHATEHEDLIIRTVAQKGVDYFAENLLNRLLSDECFVALADYRRNQQWLLDNDNHIDPAIYENIQFIVKLLNPLRAIVQNAAINSLDKAYQSGLTGYETAQQYLNHAHFSTSFEYHGMKKILNEQTQNGWTGPDKIGVKLPAHAKKILDQITGYNANNDEKIQAIRANITSYQPKMKKRNWFTRAIAWLFGYSRSETVQAQYDQILQVTCPTGACRQVQIKEHPSILSPAVTPIIRRTAKRNMTELPRAETPPLVKHAPARSASSVTISPFYDSQGEPMIVRSNSSPQARISPRKQVPVHNPCTFEYLTRLPEELHTGPLCLPIAPQVAVSSLG